MPRKGGLPITTELQTVADHHDRGTTRTTIGTRIDEPVDYAKLAQNMGMIGIGPIENPLVLAPAIRHGIETVKRGEPALIDVVTQPR